MGNILKTCIAASLLFAVGQANGDDSEMKRLQGRFERKFANQAGTVFRVVKEVAGDQSTVTTFDDVGNVVEAHSSTFKVEKRGPVQVLSFYNLLVTAGPAKGHTEPGTRSYIYRFDGETFSEAWGLLEGDEGPPRLLLWRKIKSE